MSCNSRRLTIEELLKRDGRTLEQIFKDVLLGDENAPALCDCGCQVEMDGTCPHGCPSVLLEAGLV